MNYRSIYKFIIQPIQGRYNNEKIIGDKKLIINSQIEDHKFVNRLGKVLATPLINNTNIKTGDSVIVHHNVFRRFYDVRGNEKNSRSFFEEDKFMCHDDQIFLYKENNKKWRATNAYCFVKPIKKQSYSLFLNKEKEQPLVGILKYTNPILDSLGFNKGDLVGFTPDSEYEFIVEDERLYRVTTESIIIKYEYKGDETEYNPSWTKSS
jgi:hypothetical protein